MTYIDCEKARRRYITKLMEEDIESLAEEQREMADYDRNLLLVLTEKADVLDILVSENDMVEALWKYAGIDVRR